MVGGVNIIVLLYIIYIFIYYFFFEIDHARPTKQRSLYTR